jgi:molecular chaperone GrpE
MTVNDKHDTTPDEPARASQAANEATGEPPRIEQDGGAAGAATPAPEVADLQDRYLRLAAEFDNFRKRTARERSELWGRAQADVIARLVDTVDDLARFAQVDPATTDAKAIHDGVALVERNLAKALEGLGVQRIAAVGARFDPEEHEAVSTVPAASRTRDQIVASVLQPGYRIGSLLIRPARVVVESWREDAEASPDGARPGSEA